MRYMVLMGHSDAKPHIGTGASLAEAVGNCLKEINERGDLGEIESMDDSLTTMREAAVEWALATGEVTR